MEVPGFKIYRKLSDSTVKRSMRISDAEARAYGWVLDEAPAPITSKRETFVTPPIPDIAKRAIPNYKEPVIESAKQADTNMPEVVKPKRTPRKTSTNK